MSDGRAGDSSRSRRPAEASAVDETAELSGRPVAAPADTIELPPGASSKPDAQTQATATGGGHAVPRQRAIGSRIGRYLVLEHVASGGMGAVYKAYDPELDRQIALKLHLVAGGDDRQGERLLREAQALAQLNHPNVIAVHDVGRLGDEVFVAMELVDGVTLRDWLRAGRRPLREVLDTFVAAGDGLAAAHRVGLVHRDFKPANVMIGADGRVRVLDFGLARGTVGSGARDAPRLDDSLVSMESLSGEGLDTAGSSRGSLLDSPLTVVGSIVGTPAYMAPEQHDGDEVDARTDQFSFCVALYEAVYGRRPFRGSTRRELRDAIAAGQLRTPRAGARVPRWLRRLLVRGLAAAPAARFPSMAVLLGELRRDRGRRQRRIAVLAGMALSMGALAIVARRDAPAAARCDAIAAESAVWTASDRSRVRVAFEAYDRPYAREAFADIDAALTGFRTTWSAARLDACRATRERAEQSDHMMDLRMRCLDRRARQVAELTALWAGGVDAALLQAAVPAVTELTSLAHCTPDVLVAAVPPPGDPNTARAVEALTRELDEVEVLERAGRYTDGLARSVPLTRRASELGYPAAEARALLQQGRLEHAAGKADTAIASLRRALDAAARGGEQEVLANAWLFLAELIGVSQQRFAEGAIALDAARVAVTQLGERPEMRLDVLRIEGALAIYQGDFDTAERAFVASAELVDEDGRPTAALPSVLNNLGAIALERGRPADALDYFERAQAANTASRGASHPSNFDGCINAAIALNELGRASEALVWQQRALTLARGAHGETHPLVAVAHNAIGWSLAMLARHHEAIEHLKKAQAIFEASPGVHPELEYTLSNLAEAYTDTNALDEAETMLARVHRVRLDKYGAEHADIADVELGFARLASARGRHAASHAMLASAIDKYERTLGRDHQRTAWAEHLAAILEIEHGHGPAAVRHARRAAERLAALGVAGPALARVRFDLARALALTRDDEGARSIAREARVLAGDAQPLGDEIDAWLARPTPSTPPPRRSGQSSP